jgi:hypothetical protein
MRADLRRLPHWDEGDESMVESRDHASVTPCLRGEVLGIAVAFFLVLGCATHEEPPQPAPVPPPVVAEKPAPPAPPPELPFDPSPDDKAALGATGFVGVVTVPPETGFAKGPKIAGTKPGGGLALAGLKEGDVIVRLAGVAFAATDDDAIGTLRKRLSELPPDTDTTLSYWRENEGVREVTVRLGRQPPPFNRMDAPAEWFVSEWQDVATAKLIADAIALDHGEARYADVIARNRQHLAKTDSFRLRETTQAHLDLAANETIARNVTEGVRHAARDAVLLAAGLYDKEAVVLPSLDGLVTVEQWGTYVEALIVKLAAECRAATSAWSPDERKFVAEHFGDLSARLDEGEYLFDDPNVARERANRRLIGLLAKVDRAKISTVLTAPGFSAIVGGIAQAAEADGRDGLLVASDTPFGRIEIWGGGNTRHTARTAFCFDLGGNDDWLDCAGRADLDLPVSITIDWSGNDTYGGTSPFNQGGALGGVGVLWDRAGDDQYLARSWSQGCGVAGFGLLQDDGGRDVYHGQDECQGVGFAGAGVLVDDGRLLGFRGDVESDPQWRPHTEDLYTGARFCQGVGFPGGVGAVIDKDGDDRYVCTGRYDSEYGEAGLFSGWGQGVGFGFRHIASGGIGVLFDVRGDDVYEAGNFSQGGGYFYAWGILRDDAGDDRYIGSRYAQGFAAHQAVGTFLEGGGDDLYQSHSTVACGLSWDETSVVFHDMGGDDVYEICEPRGFSLASAAHNGLVLFMDDAGSDRYAALPAHAGSNGYHGGKSFALFVDRGGDDVYGAEKPDAWNDRAFWRDEGAYFLDLPPSPKPLTEYVR